MKLGPELALRQYMICPSFNYAGLLSKKMDDSHTYIYFSQMICYVLFSTLAWKIPWMEEPGGLQSMGLLRVGHNSVNSLSLFTSMHWRRKWQPTPVFLPGESQGQGSLVGCRLWGRTESDMAEATQQQQQQQQTCKVSESRSQQYAFLSYIIESIKQLDQLRRKSK